MKRFAAREMSERLFGLVMLPVSICVLLAVAGALAVLGWLITMQWGLKLLHRMPPEIAHTIGFSTLRAYSWCDDVMRNSTKGLVHSPGGCVPHPKEN